MITEYISTYTINNKLAYRAILYPVIDVHDDDLYIVSTQGDRLDNLSNEFYQTVDNWWIIAIANDLDKSTMNVYPGLQLRIPMNIEQINIDFQQINDVDVYF